MALVSFYWCDDEVGLFVCYLVVLVGLYLALLLLIIAGFGMLVGRGVVMGLLLVLGRVPLLPYWISFCCFFTTFPGLLVFFLLVLFHFGIVLLGLLVEFLFGFDQFLFVLLLIWLLGFVKLRLLNGVFILLVFLVRVGNEFD